MAGNHEIRIRVSKEELIAIQKKADKLHMRISAFMKLLGLNANLKVDSSI